MELGYIISIAILAIVSWYVGEPLVMGVKSNAGILGVSGNTIEDLALRKEEVMLTIKDLEMDYKMQKISEADYDTLYADAVKQGSVIVQQIKTANETPTPTRSVNTTASAATRKFCTQCGTKLVPQAKFCGECGNKI